MAKGKSEGLGVGKVGYIEEHGLYTDEQKEAAKAVESKVLEAGLKTIRVIWVDQHGVPRCKFVSTKDFVASLSNGIDFSGALYNMDSGNHIFTPVFVEGGGFGIPEFTGFPDVVLVPDPTTFRVLPWADSTGWVLTDCFFGNGKPVPLDTRSIMHRQVAAAAEMGYGFLAGLEVEFYILRREGSHIGLNDTGWPPPPPPVSIFEQGYQYLSEVRLAGLNDALTEIRDGLLGAELPLRSMEDEWGPGQMEFTFDPLEGVAAADAMILFRSAVKQMCQSMGLHATFMCRPALPNFFSSGWHLHESLWDSATGKNAFSSDAETLSAAGRQFSAGILEHAIPMTVFSTPTITGYKRFKPYSFAPDNVNWAMENRGAMLRVQGEPGDQGSHVENRLGEPSANPYLFMAANIAAGLDGIRRELEPPPMVESDPYSQGGEKLPASLWEAVDALDRDNFYREAFGSGFVDFVVGYKRSEIGRFLSEVTDWEMREYFEFY
jgi:glutamine synthetase